MTTSFDLQMDNLDKVVRLIAENRQLLALVAKQNSLLAAATVHIRGYRGAIDGQQRVIAILMQRLLRLTNTNQEELIDEIVEEYKLAVTIDGAFDNVNFDDPEFFGEQKNE